MKIDTCTLKQPARCEFKRFIFLDKLTLTSYFACDDFSQITCSSAQRPEECPYRKTIYLNISIEGGENEM